LGQCELLLDGLPAGNPLAINAAEISRAAHRAATLTRQLLAYARKQILRPEILDLNQVMAGMQDMVRQITGDEVETQMAPAPGLHPVKADAGQIEQVILDMVANARDAMPDGGRLRLAARNATVAPTESIFIGHGTRPVVPAGQFVVLTVGDDGIGMDEAALARAADPFFTTKGPGKGTGLGLSMVHGFAIQSGGALPLSSRPGEGTNVELWLPRTTDPETEAGAAAQSTTAAARHLRVLLVDDDPLVVAATTGMLEELGHEAVYVAGSGEEALDVLRRDAKFDLLVTDFKMPGMSGMQLAAQARALYPSLQILLASGFAGLTAAAWPRLRKPYDLRELSAALAALEESSDRK
ncbi:MAG TPA: ATP-binding protein, partial [Xanthobacteraceae bacterium]|nr:ATP-binding protein [Xanthobacteraceae bacterium]